MNYANLEKKINYSFKNKQLLLQALTHKSSQLGFSNERLEFLGDAVLDLLVGEYLFNKFKNKGEGVLSKLRASLVNEDSFCRLAKLIDLGQYLSLSKIEEKAGGRHKSSILSDAFEALMGAIYLEGGIETLKAVFYNLMIKEFKDIHESLALKDYKSQLQELTQDKFLCTPVYNTINEEGPDHNKFFTVEVLINSKSYATSSGNNKKSAQQNAAKIALEKIINSTNKQESKNG